MFFIVLWHRAVFNLHRSGKFQDLTLNKLYNECCKWYTRWWWDCKLQYQQQRSNRLCYILGKKLFICFTWITVQSLCRITLSDAISSLSCRCDTSSTCSSVLIKQWTGWHSSPVNGKSPQSVISHRYKVVFLECTQVEPEVLE